MLFFFGCLFGHSALCAPQVNKLKVPPGFQVSLYAEVENARSLSLGSDGTVYVGTRKDKVYALLPDHEKKDKARALRTVAENLHEPNGVAFRNGDLYIAEVSRISVLRDVAKDLSLPQKTVTWGPALPKDEHHGWKFIAWGPDGWLYVPQGVPCNVCTRDENTYGTIFRISRDGKKRELIAKGVRNTVGFDWNPKTKQLWFTDNGRDLLGDDSPPDELNHVSTKGQHFGFPYCHGAGLADPEFNQGRDCAQFATPDLELPAHVAALGMRFLRHQSNSLWNGSILLAEHGSWNRSAPVGFKVVRVAFAAQDGRPYAEDFLTGFGSGNSAWGRPVDVLELEDGSVLVSDDKAGAVYRVSRKP